MTLKFYSQNKNHLRLYCRSKSSRASTPKRNLRDFYFFNRSHTSSEIIMDVLDTNQLEQCIELLRRQSIKLVVFDMDQTAVAAHSRGRLLRKDLQGFIDKATPAFRSLVPQLLHNGFSVAIATHSDEAEFSRPGIDRSTHILGKELATSMINGVFDKHQADSIFVVAYNPRFRSDGHLEENKVKRFHFRALQKHYAGVVNEEMVFFDDTPIVIEDCSTLGIRSILVDRSVGFQLSDLFKLRQDESQP